MQCERYAILRQTAPASATSKNSAIYPFVAQRNSSQTLRSEPHTTVRNQRAAPHGAALLHKSNPNKLYSIAS